MRKQKKMATKLAAEKDISSTCLGGLEGGDKSRRVARRLEGRNSVSLNCRAEKRSRQQGEMWGPITA